MVKSYKPTNNMKQVSDKIIRELRKREPVFHQKEFCSTRKLLESYAAPNFWEVGASGKVYSRKFVIDTVARRFKNHTEPDTSQWEVDKFKCRKLGKNSFMVTYRLNQKGRITRRLSIWHELNENWQLIYHQGTIIT
jgi:hypothetical protein